jgi:hypothetical protein
MSPEEDASPESCETEAMFRALLVVAVGLLLSPVALTATGPRLTAPQYRATASNICREAKRRLDAVPNPVRGGNANDLSALAPYLRAGIRIEGAEIGQLEKLKPPLSLASLVTRGLVGKRNQVVVFSELLAKANAGKMTFTEALAALSQLPDGSAIWPKVGVAVCEY